MTRLTITVQVEAKEDETVEGVQPAIPAASEVAAAIRDSLAYETRDNPYIGWRITDVEG